MSDEVTDFDIEIVDALALILKLFEGLGANTTKLGMQVDSLYDYF